MLCLWFPFCVYGGEDVAADIGNDRLRRYFQVDEKDRYRIRKDLRNSIIFAPSLAISPDDLLSEAQRRFPQVFARIPVSVTLKQSAGVRHD